MASILAVGEFARSKLTEMENRASLLRVQKMSKPSKKIKKRLFRRVADYLKSDCYMFAPLTSASPTHLLASKSSTSVGTVKMEDNLHGRNQRLIEKVGDYMKSDSYMYAPLFLRQPITSTARSVYIKRISMEVATQKLVRKNRLSTTVSSNAVVESEFEERGIPHRSKADQSKLMHKGTVESIVCQSRGPPPFSGDGVLQSKLRKILTD